MNEVHQRHEKSHHQINNVISNLYHHRHEVHQKPHHSLSNHVISNLYQHTGHGVCYVAGHYYKVGQTVRAQR